MIFGKDGDLNTSLNCKRVITIAIQATQSTSNLSVGNVVILHDQDWPESSGRFAMQEVMTGCMVICGQSPLKKKSTDLIEMFCLSFIPVKNSNIHVCDTSM